MTKQDKILESLSDILGATWFIREVYVDKFLKTQTQEEIKEDERKRPSYESKAYSLGEWVSYLLMVETNIDKKNILVTASTLKGLFIRIHAFNKKWPLNEPELELVPALLNISNALQEIYSEYESPFYYEVTSPDRQLFEEHRETEKVRWRLLSDWRLELFGIIRNGAVPDYQRTLVSISETFDRFSQYEKHWPFSVVKEPLNG